MLSRRSPAAWRPPRTSAPGDDLLAAFSRELARARRAGKSVSCLAVAGAGPVGDELVQALRLHLRRYDVVGTFDGVVVVLAPEVGHEGAEVLRARLERTALAGSAGRLGLAIAPRDGDSLDAVVNVALQHVADPEGATP